MKKDCRKYIEWKRKHPKQSAKDVTGDEKDDDDDLYTCFGTSLSDSDNSWYIDSGATAHMCNERDFFTSLNSSQQKNVSRANGEKMPVEGIGEGFLMHVMDSGDKQLIKLTGVLYVPQLHGKLLSVQKLTNKGFEVHFGGEKCTITKANVTTACALQRGGLYQLDILPKASKVAGTNPAAKAECIHTWHKRLGHRDPNAIRLLESHSAAKDFHLKSCVLH